MVQRVVQDARGEYWVTVAQAVWLLRCTDTTIRRWLQDGRLAEHPEKAPTTLAFTELQTAAAGEGLRSLSPLHPSWLELTADDGSKPPDLGRDTSAELELLRAENVELRWSRDAARADAENLDQALMAMRDNWRRYVTPWHGGQAPSG